MPKSRTHKILISNSSINNSNNHPCASSNHIPSSLHVDSAIHRIFQVPLKRIPRIIRHHQRLHNKIGLRILNQRMPIKKINPLLNRPRGWNPPTPNRIERTNIQLFSSLTNPQISNRGFTCTTHKLNKHLTRNKPTPDTTALINIRLNPKSQILTNQIFPISILGQESVQRHSQHSQHHKNQRCSQQPPSQT